MARSSSGDSVLTRVVRILDAFTLDRPVLGVSDLARAAGLPVATASRLVRGLEAEGLLAREPDGRLRVGLRLWELGSRSSQALGLRETAMPVMEVVQATVGHHTQLGVRDGDEVVFLERLQSPEAVINLTRIAGRMPLTISSSGLVLLAHAPAEVQERVLAGPLPAPTSYALTDPGQVRAVLHEIRRVGYVLNRGFVHEDAAGLAVPVRGPEGVVAALSVVVPNDARARRHLRVLQAAGRAVSRTLGGPGGAPEPIRSSIQ